MQGLRGVPFIATFELGFSGRFLSSPLVTALIEIVIGVAIYSVALLLTRALNKQDFDILRKTTPSSLNGLVDFLERMFVH